MSAPIRVSTRCRVCLKVAVSVVSVSVAPITASLKVIVMMAMTRAKAITVVASADRDSTQQPKVSPQWSTVLLALHYSPLSLSLFILSWFSTVCRLCRPLSLFGFLQFFAPLTTGHFLVSTSKHRCSASDHNGNSGRLNCPPLDLSAGASGSERVWKGLLHLRPASHLHWPTAHHKRSFITGDHVRSISLPIFLIVTGRAFLSFALSIQRTLKPSPMQAAYYLRTSACSNCAALLIGSMPPSAKASHLHAQQTPKPRWNCRGDNCCCSSSRCLKHPMNNSINSSSCCCLLGALWSLGPSLSFVAFEATTSKRQTMQHLSFIFDIKALKQSLNRKPEDNC